MLLVMFGISLVSGFFSGLLGIGGAVLLIPLLLTVPPLFGAGNLDMSEVAGLSMIQVLTASLVACATHWRSGFAHGKTIALIGIPMAIFALLGATVSSMMADGTMLMVFGCLLLASLFLIWKTEESDPEGYGQLGHRTGLAYSTTGGICGFLAGIVGAGGGFLLLPIMISILRIPTRIAVGSSLGIVFMGALFGAFGKIITMQVEWQYVLPIVIGSVPAAALGSKVSHKLPSLLVRKLLFIITAIVAVTTWYSIITG